MGKASVVKIVLQQIPLNSRTPGEIRFIDTKIGVVSFLRLSTQFARLTTSLPVPQTKPRAEERSSTHQKLSEQLVGSCCSLV
jgi:hypothetical protein